MVVMTVTAGVCVGPHEGLAQKGVTRGIRVAVFNVADFLDGIVIGFDKVATAFLRHVAGAAAAAGTRVLSGGVLIWIADVDCAECASTGVNSVLRRRDSDLEAGVGVGMRTRTVLLRFPSFVVAELLGVAAARDGNAVDGERWTAADQAGAFIDRRSWLDGTNGSASS
jgi:hypothetical protein